MWRRILSRTEGVMERQPRLLCVCRRWSGTLLRRATRRNRPRPPCQIGAAAIAPTSSTGCVMRARKMNSTASVGLASLPPPPSSGEATEILKSLVPCASVRERNLLADASRIVDRNKICKRKDDNCRKMVTDGLVALGYDASISKSCWDLLSNRRI